MKPEIERLRAAQVNNARLDGIDPPTPADFVPGTAELSASYKRKARGQRAFLRKVEQILNGEAGV
jgi:hypothetical protein